MATRILLIERLESRPGIASFAARCHEGTLHLGDKLQSAVDPEGRHHAIDVTCVEIAWTRDLLVDELDENFGGRVDFTGPDVSSLSAGWTLSNE